MKKQTKFLAVCLAVFVGVLGLVFGQTVFDSAMQVTGALYAPSITVTNTATVGGLSTTGSLSAATLTLTGQLTLPTNALRVISASTTNLALNGTGGVPKTNIFYATDASTNRTTNTLIIQNGIVISWTVTP